MAGSEFHDFICWKLDANLIEARIGALAPLVEAEIAAFIRKLGRLMGAVRIPSAPDDGAALLDLLAPPCADHPDALIHAELGAVQCRSAVDARIGYRQASDEGLPPPRRLGSLGTTACLDFGRSPAAERGSAGRIRQ
jgi:hypothetical protein